MTRRLAALGDRMLAAVLPGGIAGACIPSTSCSFSKDYQCLSGTAFVDTCTGKTNCSGACTIGVVCTRRKVGAC